MSRARQLIESDDDLKGEILGGLPPITPGEFDNFEVHGMIFLGQPGDYDNAEPADTAEDEDADFWTVFGHYAPEMAHRDRGLQGLQSIMDYDSEATANAVASELTALYAAKRFGGMHESDDIKSELLTDMRPRVRVSYEMEPEEGEEEGRRGWIEQEGVEMEPDAYEVANGETAVSNAIRYLEQERGDAMYPSSSHYHPGIWYSTRYRGARHDYHLVDFRPDEEEEIYRAMTS